MKTYSGRKAVPVKKNGKMIWIYVLPEINDQIINTTRHEKPCWCFAQWVFSEIYDFKNSTKTNQGTPTKTS